MFKKLATLVCATAVAVSAFSGVVANAAVSRDEGVSLTAEKTADNQVTVNVYAVGYDSIFNFGLNFDVTGGDVTAAAADYAAITGGTYNVGATDKVYTIASSTTAVSLTDNLILTLTLTFSENISSDITITIGDESTVMKGDEDTLEYYVEDLTEDPELVTLGFNDVTVSAGSSEPVTTVTVTPSIAEGNAKAYVDEKDDSKSAVVGKVELEISGGSYAFNRSKIKYTATGAAEGVTPTAVTDLNDNALDDSAISDMIISASDVIVYVVINGTTDIAELNNVTFE